jgi:hypothetical protein
MLGTQAGSLRLKQAVHPPNPKLLPASRLSIKITTHESLEWLSCARITRPGKYNPGNQLQVKTVRPDPEGGIELIDYRDVVDRVSQVCSHPTACNDPDELTSWCRVATGKVHPLHDNPRLAVLFAQLPAGPDRVESILDICHRRRDNYGKYEGGW